MTDVELKISPVQPVKVAITTRPAVELRISNARGPAGTTNYDDLENLPDLAGLEADVASNQAAIDAINLMLGGTAVATHLYLSATGNDAADGLAELTPVATWSRLWAIVRANYIYLGASLIIHCIGSAGSVAWSPMPRVVQLSDSARVVVVAADSTRTLVASLTAASGTDATKLVVAGPLTVDQYQHAHIEVTSGSAQGYRRTIMSNTSTDIIPLARFETTGTGTTSTTAVTPAAGDTFSVYQPGFVITGVSSVTGTMFSGIGKGDNVAPLVLCNIRIDDLANVQIVECSFYAYGVQFGGTSMPTFDRCFGSLGVWDHRGRYYTQVLPAGSAAQAIKATWLADIGFPATTAQLGLLRGWGVSTPSITSTALATNPLRFIDSKMSMLGVLGGWTASKGSYLLAGGFIWGTLTAELGVEVNLIGRGDWDNNIASSVVFKSSILTLSQGRVYTWIPVSIERAATANAINVQTGGFVTLLGQQNSISGTVLVTDGSVDFGNTLTLTAQAAAAILVTNGKFIHSGGVLTVTSTAGKALRVIKGGTAQLRGGTNTVLTGSSGNPGLHCESGGQAFVDGALTSITDNGSTATGLKVGNAAASDSAALAAAYAGITDNLGAVIVRAA